MPGPFEHQKYLLRKQALKLFGGTFRMYDPNGALVLCADMKAFKLKEDITIFPDENKTTPLINIKARQVLDISAAYDVVDVPTGQKIGVLKRKGLKSILKDEWLIMDANDNEIGTIQEDQWILALIRRFATSLVPQSFHGDIGGKEVFRFHQHFNPFIFKIDLDFTPDMGNLLDRRLGIAAGVLMCAIEGRQKD